MQQKIDAMQVAVKKALSMYNAGILTLPEMLATMAAAHDGIADWNLAGLIDPNTGLRYPA
jgi:hypothetical protein